jgi:hypothetical protein
MQTLARGMALPAMQYLGNASLSSHIQPQAILNWCLAPIRGGTGRALEQFAACVDRHGMSR